MGNNALISISVVSHKHGPFVRRLLSSLNRYRPQVDIEVILTLNVVEPSPVEGTDLSFPVTVISNPVRCGFAKNHNRAFGAARGGYFCILNPDIVFIEQVFDVLIAELDQLRAGIIAPRIVDDVGKTQENFRTLPKPQRLVARYFGREFTDELVPINENGLGYPDWIAGMFLLMRSEVFERMGGFDERYFLYYEDVDLGVRCRLEGYQLVVDTRVKVIHEARRASRKKFLFLLMHFISAVRFFLSRPFYQARRKVYLRRCSWVWIVF